MKLKTFTAVLALFTAMCNAAIVPSLSVNKDPVCEMYKESYDSKLSAGTLPSFDTEEIPSHSDGDTYITDGTNVVAVKFSQPFTHQDVNWLEWLPVANIEHNFKWNGKATDATTVGSIKPSPNTTFVFQANTVGWRGPFHRVWLIDDKKLQNIVDKIGPYAKQVPIEKANAKTIFPNQQQGFNHNLTNLFEYKGNYYTVDEERVYRVTTGYPEVVCQIGLRSNFTSEQLNALEKAANTALMTKGVNHVPMFYGTMGNQHRYVTDGFDLAINKPWLIQVSANGECLANDKVNLCEKNKRVEAVLESFAKSDAWSFREVQAIRHHVTGVQHVLSKYYTEQLNIEAKIATGMAAQAIYNFLEKTVFLHPYIRYGAENVEVATNPYTLDTPDGKLKPNWFGKTELMWAAHFNDYDTVKRLLSEGVNLTAVTKSDDPYASVQFLNRSALTYAVENGTTTLIKSLLNTGADVAIKDSKGKSLQSYFKKNKSLDVTWKELLNTPAAAIEASFNCKLARSKQEKAICASEGLSLYDQQLGLLYKKVRDSKRYPEIKILQLGWLKSLKKECSSSDEELTPCLKEKYRSRIKYLANLL